MKALWSAFGTHAAPRIIAQENHGTVAIGDGGDIAMGATSDTGAIARLIIDTHGKHPSVRAAKPGEKPVIELPVGPTGALFTFGRSGPFQSEAQLLPDGNGYWTIARPERGREISYRGQFRWKPHPDDINAYLRGVAHSLDDGQINANLKTVLSSERDSLKASHHR